MFIAWGWTVAGLRQRVKNFGGRRMKRGKGTATVFHNIITYYYYCMYVFMYNVCMHRTSKMLNKK
mgnify:CR=1 FL=1